MTDDLAYRLRYWSEHTVRSYADYQVTAPSLEAAVRKLCDAMDLVHDGECMVTSKTDTTHGPADTAGIICIGGFPTLPREDYVINGGEVLPLNFQRAERRGHAWDVNGVMNLDAGYSGRVVFGPAPTFAAVPDDDGIWGRLATPRHTKETEMTQYRVRLRWRAGYDREGEMVIDAATPEGALLEAQAHKAFITMTDELDSYLPDPPDHSDNFSYEVIGEVQQ